MPVIFPFRGDLSDERRKGLSYYKTKSETQRPRTCSHENETCHRFWPSRNVTCLDDSLDCFCFGCPIRLAQAIQDSNTRQAIQDKQYKLPCALLGNCCSNDALQIDAASRLLCPEGLANSSSIGFELTWILAKLQCSELQRRMLWQAVTCNKTLSDLICHMHKKFIGYKNCSIRFF